MGAGGTVVMSAGAGQSDLLFGVVLAAGGFLISPPEK